MQDLVNAIVLLEKVQTAFPGEFGDAPHDLAIKMMVAMKRMATGDGIRVTPWRPIGHAVPSSPPPRTTPASAPPRTVRTAPGAPRKARKIRKQEPDSDDSSSDYEPGKIREEPDSEPEDSEPARRKSSRSFMHKSTEGQKICGECNCYKMEDDFAPDQLRVKDDAKRMCRMHINEL